MSSDERVNAVKAVFIIEVLGRPPEHLVKTLEEIIQKIGEEKGVDVVNKKINEPIQLKDNKDFYTSFAEIEVEVDEPFQIIALMFKYMPAHIEIISPERLVLTNNDLADTLNELVLRLHNYDEVARTIEVEKKILENKVRQVLEENKKFKEELSGREKIKESNKPEEPPVIESKEQEPLAEAITEITESIEPKKKKSRKKKEE